MYQNILVINLMQIGDLMLTTPVLGVLRKAYPQAQLTLLADTRWRELVECNPNINRCLFMDKKGADKGLISLWRFIGKVRAQKFDLVINLHRNERASAIAAFSGAKRIVGYSKPLFSLFFDKVMQNPSIAHHMGWGPGGIFPPYRYVPGWEHQVHAHLNVLRKTLGIEPDDGGLEMALSAENRQKADSLWQEHFSVEDKVIALNIGASWETKRWPDNYFAQCADRLIEKGYKIAFFGGPMDLDIVEKCIGQMQHKDSRDLHIFTGKVSLAVLAGLLRKCVLFLTTDSGPMHIGVAMNLPVITMFGASPVSGFYPYDGRSVLLKSPENCHPCGMHVCPHQGRKQLACMKNIPVDVVMHYAEALLEKFQGKPAYALPPHKGNYQCHVIELAKGDF
ncbi:MAG: glycosyltransferase family 9 protein [Selenomonas sp.]|uniref:glycosyltransferase family 9 protein n=1 Tax=Selenomonas sp. TaxID=2053611 RepID=UPI0025E7483C|nr:glycosyltransferase family 9 protein [Selenomonas sp.]MCR5757030.1 glycosyltransferase family 9 protein [Selenomonas sp.]